MQLSLQQFETVMDEQKGKVINLCYYGCFNHRNIYEKFKLEYDHCEYAFIELSIESPDQEFMVNTLLKQDIKEITYLDISGQIQLILVDGNRILIDLEEELDLDES